MGAAGSSAHSPGGPRLARRAVGPAVLVVALFLGTAVSAGILVPGTASAAPTNAGCPASSVAPCDRVVEPPAAAPSHDLTLTAFNLTVLRGNAITLYATLPAGVTAKHFDWQFGDGTTSVTTSGVTSHTYATAGTYEVYVNATTASGVVHDNLHHLLLVGVTASYTSDGLGNLAQLSGTVVSNSTTKTRAAAILSPGGAATVSTDVVGAPESLLATFGKASFVLGGTAQPYATLSGETVSAAGKSTVTVTFASDTPFGLYPLVYADPTHMVVNGSTVTADNNYTFTLAVGSGLGGTAAPQETSSHPGTLVAYEQASSNPVSIDPATDYESMGGEIMANIYQGLLYANGTLAGPDPADFDPGLAVCVPGSAQCEALFGSSLISGGTYYTFVINPAARFYDNATGASWGVYPSDVMFSVARALAYADLPAEAVYPGWILAQALLPYGNGNWDGGIHAPFNNTPQEVLDSMYVNDSAYCPAAAISQDHGCLTFVADGGGGSWPQFLAMVGQPFSALVESCGFDSAPTQGAGLPYWPSPRLASGDLPCLLPGNATSTSAASFTAAVAAMSPTGWDAYEDEGLNNYPVPVAGVEWRSVGSGPYYAAHVNNTSGYELEKNPAFASDPYCTWSTCEPTAGKLYGTVRVYYVRFASEAFAALANGSADLADNVVLTSSLRSTVDGLLSSGAGTLSVTPTLSTFAPELDLEYSPSAAKSLFGRSFTAPANLLTDGNLRQFLVASFPTETMEENQGIVGGIATFFPSGGAVPERMGDYYPTNVSWPLGTPDADPADVGGAAWWWAQADSDPAVAAACTVADPCTFPVVYMDNSTLDVPLSWISWVVQISGGAVKPIAEEVPFSKFVDIYFATPGTNPAAIWNGGWIPDYSDPTDFVTPSYLPNETWTFLDAVSQGLDSVPTASNCPASLTYWSSLATPIPEGCQGKAYGAMVVGLENAASAPLGTGRVLLYNEAEHVARALALQPPNFQENWLRFSAPWIQASSLAEDPDRASDAINLWFDVRASTAPATALALRGVVVDPNPVALNGTVNLYALATGGTGGFSYSWSGVSAFGCTSSSGPTLTCVANHTGTFSVKVTATDASGKAISSATVTVTVTEVSRPRRRG